MMFAGTSGVLSHTLAHAPMATTTTRRCDNAGRRRSRSIASTPFSGRGRPTFRATRRRDRGLERDETRDGRRARTRERSNARARRDVDVERARGDDDAGERAPMLAPTPIDEVAMTTARATTMRAIGACAIVGMVGAVTMARARADAGATATMATLGVGQDLAARENARDVRFEVDTRCPPDDYLERHADFFARKIVKVTMVDKCAGETGWNWEFNLGNPETAHEMSEYEGRRRGVWHASVRVDNRCEYGFVLTNELGEKRWEIGGDNVDTPLEDKGCSSEEVVGGNGNVYNNRLMRDWPDSDAIRWAWGRCLSHCPATSRLYAVQRERSRWRLESVHRSRAVLDEPKLDSSQRRRAGRLGGIRRRLDRDASLATRGVRAPSRDDPRHKRKCDGNIVGKPGKFGKARVSRWEISRRRARTHVVCVVGFRDLASVRNAWEQRIRQDKHAGGVRETSIRGWRLGLGRGVGSSTFRGLSNPVRLGRLSKSGADKFSGCSRHELFGD